MFPKIILIDTFNGCNLTCSICDHKNMRRPIKKMPWKLYTRIIDEISEKSPESRIWQIFFGDPLLCDDMPGRLAYAKQRSLTDVVLNTNGLLMTKDKAKVFIDAGLDWMYVGVDAYTKETYDKIRIGGNLDRVIQNVLNYRDMSDKIFVQFVECKYNKHEKEKFLDFWKSHDVKVKIRPMVSWINLVDSGRKKKRNKGTCYWYKNSMSICNDGRIALCACDIHCRYPIGDVLNSNIEKEWKKIQNTEQETCKTCGDWEAANAEYYV